jgi:AraC-like DNA-binding protein
MPHYLSSHAGYVLHERAEQYYGEGAGFLSIKSFFHGQALYSVGRGQYAANDRSYLVLNHGQPYTISIEADRPVESFCLFFAPGFAETVQYSLTTAADRILLEPQASSIPPLTFFKRTYPHDALLSPALFQLRSVFAHYEPEPNWLIEQFHAVMQRLLQVHTTIYKEVDALPAARAATREELYRRLHSARDYAAALFATPITLNDMADVAALSPNHLLRMFKQLFHQTPYQYITSKRLEHAQYLLAHTEQSVTEICFAVGFESLGAFSWRFRRRIGVSPSTFRQQSR